MPLKMLIESLDGVPEALHGMYSKTEDGKFRLDVEGIEDPKDLKSALQKEREARASFEKKLKAFDGLDVEQLRQLQSQLENDEELQLVAKGKLGELRSKWTEKMAAEMTKKVKEAEERAVAQSKRADRWSTQVLDNAIRAAASKAGLHTGAIDDALLHGRQLFTLDENGNAVQLRDGAVVLGKDGKTPYTPDEWLEGMRESKPHWYPASGSGSGAQQQNRDTSGGNGQHRTIKRAHFDKLNAKEKMALSKEGIQIVD